MFSQLQIYGASKGLENTNECVYGMVDGMYVSLEIVNNVILIHLPIADVSRSAMKSMKKKWKKTPTKLALTNVRQEKNSFIVGITGNPKDVTVEIIDYTIDMVVSTIKKEGGHINNVCYSCGVHTDQFAFNGEAVIASCPNCVTNINHKIEEGKVPVYTYFTGIIGAILGGVIGSIPYLAVAYFMNTLLGVLSLVFAHVAFSGYKLFKGAKVRWFAHVVVALVTIALNIPFFIFFNPDDFIFTFIFAFIGIITVNQPIKKYSNPSKLIPVINPLTKNNTETSSHSTLD